MWKTTILPFSNVVLDRRVGYASPHSALDDIIDPFYGDEVPRQQGKAWRLSFSDLEGQT